ncbi:MAG: protein kinase [Planctomycetota bacterium]
MQGSRIGTYQIEHEIGRGGMGVVYLGRDMSLDRAVAIKALPPELADDPSRLERFEREAKTLAQLSDPHIAGIYGTESHEGQRYLILEYVEGETLADRLDRGPLPVDETLELGTQIAAGLEAAHEAGVIHRDLKPANIKLTPEGKALVLDFGLAKADEGTSSTGLSDAATLTTPAPHSPSVPGAVIGTAAYMSPEQARGHKVDRRTDIWAFGVVLYEMLTGSSPFAGETATDSIGAVLHKGVELEHLPKGTPLGVQRLIERCLERDKNMRLQAIGDARIELRNELDGLGSVAATIGALHAQPRSVLLPSALSAFFAALATGIALALATPTGPFSGTQPPFTVGDMRQLTDFEGLEQRISLSPDGKTLLYSAADGEDRDIYFLRVGGANPINLTPDSDADDFDPAFSPDGERIAFCSTREGGGVFVMGATGENPRRVADAGFDPAWSPDGRSLIVTSEEVYYVHGRLTRAGLSVINLETRETRKLDTGEQSEDQRFDGDAVDPSFSPDGSRVLFWSVVRGNRDIFTIAAEGGDPVALTDDVPTDWSPVWAGSSSRVLFLSDRGGSPGVWSIELDPETGRRISDPTPLLRAPADLLELATTPDASRIALTSQTMLARIRSVGFDQESGRFTGDPVTLVRSTSELHQAHMTDDGSRLVYRTGPPFEDVIVSDGDGSNRRRLTDDRYRDRKPAFFDGGSHVAWHSNRGGAYSIWEMRIDGTNLRRFEGIPERDLHSPIIFADGAEMLVAQSNPSDTSMLAFSRRLDDTWTPARPPVGGLLANVVSPDGTRTTVTILENGAWTGWAIRTLADGHTVRMTRPDGTPMLPGADLQPHDWIDNDTLLFIDLGGELLLIDAETGSSRPTGDRLGNVQSLYAYRGGTEFVYVEAEAGSEVWLTELNPAPASDR